MFIQSFHFYGLLGGLYVAQHLGLGLTRTTRFGLLNMGALALLCGWRVAILALAISTASWVTLSFRRSKQIAQLWHLVPYVVASAMILFQKLGGPVAVSGSLGQQKLGAALLALSLSYVALRCYDMMRSVEAGAPLLDPLGICGYLFPFFMLPAGPVNLYRGHAAMDQQVPPRPTFTSLLEAANLVTTGMVYKLVIAESLRMLTGPEGQELGSGFLAASGSFIYLFFDFAGYSLIALGAGRMLGIPTPRNFDLPFKAATVTEFWTRWHMSLSEFVRRHIFTVLQVAAIRRFGLKRAYACNFGALIVAFSFVGLWHQLSWRFLLWGACMGTVIGLEKIIRDKFYSRLPKSRLKEAVVTFGGPVYTFFTIAASLQLVLGDFQGAA